MNDRDALIIIKMIPGIGPVRVKELLTRFGNPKNILQLSKKALTAVPDIGGQSKFI